MDFVIVNMDFVITSMDFDWGLVVNSITHHLAIIIAIINMD